MQAIHEFRRQGTLDIQMAARHARLTAAHEACPRNGRDRKIEIRIPAYEVRIDRTDLEIEVLARGGGADLEARGSRAGK